MSDEGHFYLVDGEPLALKRVRTARLVVPARNSHGVHVGARLARSSRMGLETAVSKNYLVVRGDADKLDEVSGYSDVACTRSAFIDPEGIELFLTDEVLVRFSSKWSDDQRRKLCEKLNCIVIDAGKSVWTLRVKDADEDAPLTVANKLADEKEVEFAEPNALQKAVPAAVLAPDEPYFQNQWHLENTGQGGGTPGADVKALEAWKITTGDPGIRVVVHDSGVDIGHPDLAPNIGPGWDFDNEDSDASNNLGPHGTACAGVIAAARNERGVVGVAHGCKITPLRAAGGLTWSTWARTFAWAAENGEVISCSWSITRNNTLIRAIREVVRDGRGGKGTPVFCATGNDFRRSISFPASMRETIGVGASTNRDVRSPYSNFGRGIDVVAPSSGGTLRIETTDVRGAFGYNVSPEGDYCKAADSSGFGGTSSATPLAAGVGALMLSANPELTAEEVREILQNTADKIDSKKAHYKKGWSSEYGYGRINAARAVAEAKSRAN